MAKKNSFEQSFERLEEILEKMNSSEVGLDQSLSLYEEADKLILQCHEELSGAEKKVEKLIKDRQNKLCLDENQKPQKEGFDIETLGE